MRATTFFKFIFIFVKSFVIGNYLSATLVSDTSNMSVESSLHKLFNSSWVIIIRRLLHNAFRNSSKLN